MKKICIIGLGYVGLPLALEFGKKFDVIGFDTNKHRIKQLNAGLDITKEVSKHELQRCKKIEFDSIMFKPISYKTLKKLIDSILKY